MLMMKGPSCCCLPYLFALLSLHYLVDFGEFKDLFEKCRRFRDARQVAVMHQGLGMLTNRKQPKKNLHDKHF
jgi:hypothetical protein